MPRMRRKRRASFGRFCKEFFKLLGSSEETDNFTFNVWRVHRHCRIKCDRVQQGAAVELRWAAKPIDLRTVYPHGESAYVSAAAVAPVEGVQRLVQSGGQRQKPYVCAIRVGAGNPPDQAHFGWPSSPDGQYREKTDPTAWDYEETPVHASPEVKQRLSKTIGRR